jgi:2-phospho-L-lactate guanylyltransferase
MNGRRDIWAVVPVKEIEGAKQRLAEFLSPDQRRTLAATMLRDVLRALVQVKELAGIAVVTLDPHASELAAKLGARIITEGARDGHTGAVTAAGRVLLRERRDGMLTVPGDIPRIAASEVRAVLAAHRPGPSFTIAPAHDEKGSNAVLLSPPDSVPLRFGEDSYFPHLDAARRAGIEPRIVALPGIGMDIDHPADLAAFLRMTPRIETETLIFLEESGLSAAILAAFPSTF